MSKEYSLKDLYNEQSEEEEEDSDFVLEENEESEGSEIEESEAEEESTVRVTRKRPLEEAKESFEKKAKMDAIWKEMNETKPTKEKVKEKVKEKEPIKEVVVREEEGKERMKKINRPKSILSSLVSQYDIKIPKMNTLEKSKLDWQKFVEKEDIQDDLKYKNKDGYMEKVEFLQRVDDRRLQQLKAGQKTNKK